MLSKFTALLAANAKTVPTVLVKRPATVTAAGGGGGGTSYANELLHWSAKENGLQEAVVAMFPYLRNIFKVSGRTLAPSHESNGISGVSNTSRRSLKSLYGSSYHTPSGSSNHILCIKCQHSNKILDIRRPMTPFSFWAREFRHHKEAKSLTVLKDFVREASKQWLRMPIMYKLFWISLSQSDCVRYNQDRQRAMWCQRCGILLDFTPYRSLHLSTASLTGSDVITERFLHKILDQRLDNDCVSTSPTELIQDVLYIGSRDNAKDVKLLRKLGVTHVMNCAAVDKLGSNPYHKDSGITGYHEFDARDTNDYPILNHFPDAYRFIDAAIKQGGKVFVHCVMGVNRSGAICVAYMMAYGKGQSLLKAARDAKERRRTILTNRSFRRQLVVMERNITSGGTHAITPN